MTPHHHPLVNLLFDEMRRQYVSIPKLSKRSGVSEACIKGWRSNGTKRRPNNPNIVNLAACLGAMGYRLKAEREHVAAPEQTGIA